MQKFSEYNDFSSEFCQDSSFVAKFIYCWWRNRRCDCHVTHTPKCDESAKIRAKCYLWLI